MGQTIREQLINARARLDEAINALPVDPEQVAASEPEKRLLPWGAKVSSDFKEGVLWIEDKLGLDADNLMACMAFETGGTFSPSIKNPSSSATGLIQFMEATAKDLGTTTSALRQMTALKQLSFVYKYFARFGKDLSGWTLGDTYMAILLPSMIGKDDDAPMRWSATAYRVNAGLDADKNGVVTKGEAVAKVQRMFELGSSEELLG